MPSRAVVGLSLAANACLLAVVASLFQSRVLAPAPMAGSRGGARRFVEPGASLPASTAPVPGSRGGARRSVEPGGDASLAMTRDRFNWRELHAGDFRAFTASLRAAGCPEQTVHDIVLPAMARHFEKKRKGLDESGRFWLSGPEHEADERARREQQRALDATLDALLKELFALDCVPVRHAEQLSFDKQAILFAVLGFLPQDTVDRALEVMLRTEKLHTAVDKSTGGILLDADFTAKERLYERTRDQLRELVGPALFEEGELRVANIGEFIRFLRNNELEHFELTGAELRELTRRRLAVHNEIRDEFTGAERDEGTKKATEAAVDEVAREYFGEARFKELLRARDPAFGEFADVAKSHNLPRDAAVKAHEVRKAVEAQAATLADDATLADTQRRAAFNALRAEAGKSFSTALGHPAAVEYLQRNGTWLEQLGREPAREKTDRQP